MKEYRIRPVHRRISDPPGRLYPDSAQEHIPSWLVKAISTLIIIGIPAMVGSVIVLISDVRDLKTAMNYSKEFQQFRDAGQDDRIRKLEQ